MPKNLRNDLLAFAQFVDKYADETDVESMEAWERVIDVFLAYQYGEQRCPVTPEGSK